MAGPSSLRKKEGRFGKKLGGQYVDRGFYRGVSNLTGSALMYFTILSIGSAIIAAALLGLVAAYFIYMWRKTKR
tara:strand:+ start:66 stop:287 length:222 start_codon:yes stop_codon:yes gene_type:complete